MPSTFQIKARWSGRTIFEAEIAAEADEPYGLRLGLAVRIAVSSGADMSGADLRGADMSGADMSGADLRGADMSGADMSGANLRGADMSGADVSGANLRGADLRDANLRGANLSGANLSGAKDIPEIAAARSSITPEGELIGWKKCQGGVIVKLRIPTEARRSNATGRKCRAEFADVLEVFGADFGVSQHDGKTEYRAGQRVTPDAWCEDRWQECASGIHFFLNRPEAEAY